MVKIQTKSKRFYILTAIYTRIECKWKFEILFEYLYILDFLFFLKNDNLQ